jgi:3-deoxy-manno-octulosonate cytidylyltransferase (CMP-KDO synthetase)
VNAGAALPGAAVAVIPVRVDSKRLPGKALLAESGKPLFLHTCDQARKARAFARVIVATDDSDVAGAAKGAGLDVVMTTSAPRTGSERCAQAIARIPCEYVVDIQGDWPEVDPEDLDALVAELRRGECPVGTLAVAMDTPEDAAMVMSANVVKVVRDLHGRALYFSRSPVPHVRPGQRHPLLRHIGVYAFTRKALLALPDMTGSGLEEAEGLEQLRWLENGYSTKVLLARGRPWGIEAREDYDAFLSRRQAAARAHKEPQS